MTTLAVLDRLQTKAVLFWLLVAVLFATNIAHSYLSYKKLTEFEYATIDAKLISSKEIRGKSGDPYFSLFFHADGLNFRTYSKTDMKSKEGERFGVVVKTKELSFLDMFKTPRLRTLSMSSLGEKEKLQAIVKEFIASQHEDEIAKEIYLNLFLNSEVTQEVESFINGYGLGAFFAISGLNVALLMASIFFLLSPIFRFFQDRFFTYANRTIWISLFCFVVLFFYAYLTDFTPSFVRAVVAAVVVFYFALRGEEIINYKTLLLTTALCLALFPSFLFSIGFWLSFYGVFLIFLFLENTQFKNKAVIYVALSSWLFAAMLPVIHYIFAIFTKAHLLNSLFSAIFDLFYPLSLVAHLAGVGWVFDDWLLAAVKSSKELVREEFLTPLWFLVLYLIVSFAAAFYKQIFFAFNILIAAYFVAAMWFLWR